MLTRTCLKLYLYSGCLVKNSCLKEQNYFDISISSYSRLINHKICPYPVTMAILLPWPPCHHGTLQSNLCDPLVTVLTGFQCILHNLILSAYFYNLIMEFKKLVWTGTQFVRGIINSQEIKENCRKKFWASSLEHADMIKFRK